MNKNSSSYKHLNIDEREQIAYLRAKGDGINEIARLIGRNKGTVSRELKRNAPKKNKGYYVPYRAQVRSEVRMKESHKKKD
ncbi:MAG: helix-turn-helix domain-containing protein [Spirochaetia bacterium]|nr:helix-turn-helix domain-containing protein [Spirochaetia bacterium]